MVDKYKNINNMEVAGITNLKRFVDDFFGKTDKSSYTSQDSDKADPKRLFSHLKRECALVMLSRFGYLFTEEEFYLSLETIAKNHIVKKKTELPTSSCKTKRVSKYGFEPLFVF